MARKNDTPKALLAVKHDFVAALDNHIAKAMMLYQAVQTVLELKAVDARVADKLRAAAEAFEASFVRQEE